MKLNPILIFKNLKVKKLFLLFAVGIFFSSCLTNVEEPFLELDPALADPCETITFSTHVKPIVEVNCVQCHGVRGHFPNLTTYAAISANAALVKSVTVSRRMPQGSATLTNEEIAAISCWVDAGALND
jgi:uncharacterized membrane protein